MLPQGLQTHAAVPAALLSQSDCRARPRNSRASPDVSCRAQRDISAPAV